MNASHTIAVATLWSIAFVDSTAAAPVDDTINALQHRWEEVKYATPPGDQKQRFAKLAAEADQALAQFPNQADVLIWHGIIVASYAGTKGGLGALRLAKNARKDFEAALKINPKALSGAAYTSLGSLYYQVPGWPLGFGNKGKAAEYLKHGLDIDPNGVDANYFYGDFLYRDGNVDGAEQYLRKALLAPSRAGRKLADEGRRSEIKSLLEKIAAQRK